MAAELGTTIEVIEFEHVSIGVFVVHFVLVFVFIHVFVSSKCVG
jgi:hypothetical protein